MTQDRHSPGLAAMNSSIFVAQVFGEATGETAPSRKTATLTGRRHSDWSAGW